MSYTHLGRRVAYDNVKIGTAAGKERTIRGRVPIADPPYDLENTIAGEAAPYDEFPAPQPEEEEPERAR